MNVVEIITSEGDADVPSRLTVLGRRAASGGVGAIYFSDDGKWAIKIFWTTNESEIAAIFNRLRAVRERFNSEEEFFAIPKALVRHFNGNPCAGFVMRRIPSDSYVLLEEVTYDISDFHRGLQAGCTWGDYLRISRSIAYIVNLLESKALVHTDLSPTNIYVDMAKGQAILIDMDSCVLDHERPLNAATPRYVAPELLTSNPQLTIHAARHSLAVILLQTLLFRNVMEPQCDYTETTDANLFERAGYGEYALFSEDPDNGRHWPLKLGRPVLTRHGSSYILNKELIVTPANALSPLSYRMLSPMMQTLTRQTFLDGLRTPGKRAEPLQWRIGLEYTRDQLCRCGACGHIVPFPFWQPPASPARLCHLCHASLKQWALVLRFFKPGARPHKYEMTDRVVICSSEFSHLYKDMLHIDPVPTERRESIGVVSADTNGAYLRNDSKDTWIAYSPRRQHTLSASRGEMLQLEPQTILRFGDSGVVALVSEI